MSVQSKLKTNPTWLWTTSFYSMYTLALVRNSTANLFSILDWTCPIVVRHFNINQQKIDWLKNIELLNRTNQQVDCSARYRKLNLVLNLKMVDIFNRFPQRGWRQSKSALNQSKDILFFWKSSTLFMSQFTLASLDFWLIFTAWKIICSV